MNHRAELAFAALIFLFFSVITLTVASRQMVPTGDEPHYLVTAHSLAVDGDLQLLNNYKNQDYRLFYPGGLAKRTTSNFDKSRELPAFGLGPAIFLTPFYWLAFTYFPSLLVPFLRLVVCSITSVALYQLLIVGSAVSARACTMLTVAAAALTSPLLTYCSQFYPEIFAFLLIVLALREFQSLEAHPLRSGVCLSLFSPALLWLHPKYLILSLLIMLYSAYRLRANRGAQAMMVVISLAGIISWFVFLHSEYGSWSPNRIYGGWQKQTSFVQLIQEEGLERFWIMIRMMFGFWIDQRFGVIPYAPFYAAFFPALIWFVRKGNSVLKAPLLILFLFHYLALSWGAPLGGYSPPSRHFVVLLPFVLIALMTVMPQWNAWQKRCFVVLAGAGCLVSFLILTHYRTIFTDATWRNPDGYSVFWQTFHMENWIPRMTAVHLELGLIALWLSCIIALSILFYPRQQWKH